MPLGQLWGTLFFLFMRFAALSTVIAVFETTMAFSMDQWGVRREKACLVNGALIALLSIPCVLGFNVLSGVAIPGIGDIQSIEDFLVSNNILPLGGLFLVMFVTSKRGWGWKNFLAEADTGEGLRLSRLVVSVHEVRAACGNRHYLRAGVCAHCEHVVGDFVAIYLSASRVPCARF